MKKLVTAMLCGMAVMCLNPVGDVRASEVSIVKSEIDAVGSGEFTLQVSSGMDISAAIEKALDAGETTIRIPAGTYTVNSQFNLDSNITIIADGATIKATGNSDTIFFSSSDKNHSNLSFQGGTWDGGNKTGSAVFRFYNTSGLKISGAEILNSGGSGILLNECTNAVITNVKLVHNAEYGINVNDSSVAISNSQANGNKKSGFFAQEKSTMDLSNVSADSNTEKGIYYNTSKGAVSNSSVNSNSGEGITATTSTVNLTKVTSTSNKGHGIGYSSSASGTVSGVEITKNGQHGLLVSDSKVTLNQNAGAVNLSYNDWNGVSVSGSSSEVSIAGGNYNNNGQDPKTSSEGESGHGIGVFEGAAMTASGVVCQGNNVCGISPFGKGTTLEVTDSNISNNGRHGIGMRLNVTVTATNCIIEKNAQHGIMDNDRSTATISDCTINANKKSGICVGESSKATISNTDISSNLEEGIYVYDSSSAKITKGSSSNNRKCGITTNENATVTVSGTEFEDNKMYGVNIKGGKADIQSCIISDNVKSGVQIKKADAGKKEAANVSNLSKNKITDNGQYGIYVNASTVSKMQKNTIIDHTKCGIGLYKKATSKKIENNSLSNPKGREIYVESGVKSNVTTSNVLTINTVKKNAKKVSGTAYKKVAVKVEVDGKTYKGTAKSNGKYSVKTDKLAKNDVVEVSAKDSKGNTFKNSTVVK